MSYWASLDVFMAKGKLEKVMTKALKRKKIFLAHLFMKVKEIWRKGR